MAVFLGAEDAAPDISQSVAFIATPGISFDVESLSDSSHCLFLVDLPTGVAILMEDSCPDPSWFVGLCCSSSFAHEGCPYSNRNVGRDAWSHCDTLMN